MIKTLILTLVVVGVSLLLLNIRVILKKNGRFSSEHISENKKMHENGITCATSQDRKTQRENKVMNVNEL